MTPELLNKLIDSKYIIIEQSPLTQIYRIYTPLLAHYPHSVTSPHNKLYLGSIRYHKDYAILVIEYITHTISYSDPDYQTKINDLLETKLHQLNQYLEKLTLQHKT